MKLGDIYNDILKDQKKYNDPVSDPCSLSELKVFALDFTNTFGLELPDGYINTLKLANGISYSSLDIWPISENSINTQTIYEANKELKDTLSEDYIYFAS